MKLLFYPPITIRNDLLLMIYFKNIVDIAWWDEKKNIETVKKKNIKLKFTTNVVLWEMFETVIFYACGSYYGMMRWKK